MLTKKILTTSIILFVFKAGHSQYLSPNGPCQCSCAQPQYNPPAPSYQPAPSPTYQPAPSYQPSPAYQPAPAPSPVYQPAPAPTNQPVYQPAPSYQPIGSGSGCTTCESQPVAAPAPAPASSCTTCNSPPSQPTCNICSSIGLSNLVPGRNYAEGNSIGTGNCVTAKEGDSMWTICTEQLGITLQDCEARNPEITHPDLIYPGQRICA